MPRHARIHFVSLRSSLVNLPISIYGPLVERSVRPQGLAIHLSLVPSENRPERGKKEAYVGWTGMASASSLASINSVNGDSLGTIEIDPQYAQALGFLQGDLVEIGLLHDLPYAKSVGTEPVTADDWEIIDIHASHVESTLLSQVRVANIGQEIDVWVLGRTRVRLTVVSLDPTNKSKVLLLTTDTEVSIAPKLHNRQQLKSEKVSTKSANTDDSKGKIKSPPPPSVQPHCLRVIPSRVLARPFAVHSGSELLGFVSPITFTKLTKLSEPLENDTHVKAHAKRLPPPTDPSSGATASATPDPVPLVLKPGEKEPTTVESGSIYLGRFEGIPNGHIVLPTTVDDIEEWDLASVSVDTDSSPLLIPSDKGSTSTVKGPPPITNFLAGVDDILTRCTEFCIRTMILHSTKTSVRGVSSLLVTGRPGAGKTSIVKAVSKRLQENPKTYAYVHYVDVTPYADKPVSTVKALFKYWFDKAAWHKPSILILDNVEHLLKAEEEHTDSFRIRQLVELFVYLYSSSARSNAPNSRGIILVATAPSASALHPLLNSKHIFSEIVHVKTPNKDARRDILSQIVKDRLQLADDMQEDPTAPLNYTYIATQTEGYSATDLQDLVARAVHQSAIKIAMDEKPALLTQVDFDVAQVDFVPLSLRDVKTQKSDITWSDVGGLKETKRVLRETLEWPTKYGLIFAQSPLRLRSGLLLYGYPGCGKTLLASAVAKECGLNFISVKGPEVLNKYIGASEKTVRDLFERASAAKPCVLFFDEFDSIAPKRGHDSTGVTDRVVNQMLTQMDGAEGLDGVYVLAATSRPDLIDSALLRPGRLDKSLLCNMPNFDERKDILKAVTRKVALAPTVDLDEIADSTEGFSGADLQALVYNANLEVVHSTISLNIDGGSSSREEETPLEYTTFGRSKDKAVSSKAEKTALQKRLRQIQTSCQTNKGTGKSEKNAGILPKKQHVIHPEHFAAVLKTTRPSVPIEERVKLDRIYREFASDRTGELPVPPEGSGVGIRASLG
ncbi:AAA-domain-containing protein [Guyanagaster necrorhizus]|uniref:Peroxisomal ATPase PEX1 n=1 Tax=Guyanagaster necrorhizus TaxID=856835 RepID=A0A9P7W0G6_9AGAR|nr:AAA-domain-containing protein [Guyanagaster necrorhizus MCA 3950]KAG7449775.1 AAA-domain-containing protein [Guyanagaster necrorhizus MCA 3950]